MLEIMKKIVELLKAYSEFSFFDIFETKEEIWFNYGKDTYIISIRKVE